MSSHPYMPLYVGSYLKNTLALTTEQHGAYLLLLMAMWSRSGELPNDPKVLAKIAGVTPKRWPRVWAGIEEHFVRGHGFIRHDRVLEELQKADQISLKRSLAGKRGAVVKSLKYNKEAKANAEQVNQQTLSSQIRSVK